MEEEAPIAPAQAKPIWQAYSSLGNVQHPSTVERAIAAARAADCDWIATEKVHGANFCFETDGVNVEYSSRSRRLAPGDEFFNVWTAMPQYHPFVLEAFRLMQERRPDLQRLLIYGEYFGGWYPGHRAPMGVKKVQGGVAYSPAHHFWAFDVKPNQGRFLDFDDARELLLAAGFPLVMAAIKRGTLEELLEFDVETLETCVPALLGLEAAEVERISEGIVIRPAREMVLPTSSGHAGGERAILKKKARRFWEGVNQHSVTKLAYTVAPDVPDWAPLVELARDFVNENRLRAVISKDPDLLDTSKSKKLAWLVTVDALEEFKAFYQDELERFGKDVVGRVQKLLKGVSDDFVQAQMPAIRADIG